MVTSLSDYEKRQVELIEKWMSSPPSITAKGVKAVKGAAGKIAKRVLPNGAVEKFGGYIGVAGGYVQKAIPFGAIEGAINANIRVAHLWTRETSVLKELGVENFEAIALLNLQKLDALANKTHNLAGSYRVPGCWLASSDECSDEGAKQGFAASASVVHELEEAEIKRKLVL